MGPQGGDSADLPHRLARVIEPITARAGLDLERVRVSRLGRRHRVEVTVDRDGGVDLDTIAEVSRAVSAALDTAETTGDPVLAGEHVLEVSSPGVDRPLTEPRHWRRNLGRLVTVPGPAGETLTGRVAAAHADTVVLDVDGTPRTLGYAQLGPGQVQVELRPSGPPDDAPDREG